MNFPIKRNPHRTGGPPPPQLGDIFQTSYSVVYDVNACGDDSSWASIESHEQITTPDGHVKNIVVNPTLANPVGGNKYYPINGTHFPQGLQGFLMSPRNTSVYNWQFIYDSYGWNSYQIEAINIRFETSCSDFDRGSFEAIFLDQGVNSPSVPFEGSQKFNVMSTAVKKSHEVTFSALAGQQGVNFKNPRTSTTTFDRTADFGILWWRTYGVNPQTPNTPFSIGKIFIKFLVSWQGQVFNNIARLIGPWAAAGYPIEGGQEVREIAIDSAVSGNTVISPESYDELVRKGKQSRWHLITHTGDRGVLQVPRALLGNHRLLKGLRAKHFNAAPSLLQAFYTYSNPDAGVSGVKLIKRILDSGIVDGAKVNTSTPDTEIVVYSGQDQVFPNGGICFRENQIAEGSPTAKGIICSIKGGVIPQGGSMDLIVQNVNVIACTHDATPANAELPQVSFGYDSDQGSSTVPGLDQIITSESLSLNTQDTHVTRNAILASGIKYSTNSNGFSWQAVNTAIGGIINAVKPLVSDGNASFNVSDMSYDTPDTATFRAPVITLPDGQVKSLLTTYFSGFPCVSKYGIGPFNPSSISNTVNMIKVNYHCATTVGGVVSLIGGNSDQPVDGSIDNDMLIGLLCSRYSPTDDPQAFVETAIIVTPALDGFTQSHGYGSIYQQQTTGSAKLYQYNKTSTSSTYMPLSHFGVFQTSTPTAISFAVPWPSHLPTADGQLEPLTADTPVYFNLIRGTATKINVTFTSSVSGPTLVFAPQLAQGAHDIILTSPSADSKIVTGVALGDTIDHPPPYLIDVERSSIISGMIPSLSRPDDNQ